jgi:hypothetical protein
VGSYELHEHSAEREGYVDHQSVFIAAQVKDDAIVANEIDGGSELALYLCRIRPMRDRYDGKPSTNWTLGSRVTRPEFFQRPTSDYLHLGDISMSPVW